MHKYKVKVHIKNTMNGVNVDQKQIFTMDAESRSKAKEELYAKYSYVPRQNLSITIHKKF